MEIDGGDNCSADRSTPTRWCNGECGGGGYLPSVDVYRVVGWGVTVDDAEKNHRVSGIPDGRQWRRDDDIIHEEIHIPLDSQ